MYHFTEDCMTGIMQIDEEHQRLFQMINEAFQLVESGEVSILTAKSLMNALSKYASEHFTHEEDYMERINDPELTIQRVQHQAFRDKLESVTLDNVNEAQANAIMQDLLQYLSRWLYRHILKSDLFIGQEQLQGNKPVKDNIFAFTEEYHTGIAFVDEEHKRLFEIIRETDEVIHAELLHDKYDQILRILEELRDYTEMHFQDEEAYMKRIGYEGLEAQKIAHNAFVEKLKEINLEDVDDHQEQYLEELIDYLLGWLIHHILKTDKLIPVSEEAKAL